MAEDPTHASWRGMRERCNSPGHKSYLRYGGRGVKVCSRWSRFTNFLADMGARPDGMTLDRIDNSRGYMPGNCRWATATMQSNNRRDNVVLTHGGRTQTASQWARELGMKGATLRWRYRKGWGDAEILETPAVLGRNSR